MQYSAVLKRRCEVAQDTIALTFTRPEGFSFRAGDYAVVSIPGLDDGYDREFSIASAPYENLLEIAMRVRGSAFKRFCSSVPLGAEFTIGDPTGSLGSHGIDGIWLVGGIGIAPFRSLVRDALHEKAAIHSHLFWVNRTRLDMAYGVELLGYAARKKHLGITPVFSSEHPDRLSFGRMLKNQLQNYAAHEVFTVVGTRPFVAAMRDTLSELQVPQERIRSERFCGYTTHDSTVWQRQSVMRG